MNTKTQSTTKKIVKRYTAEEKGEILDFIKKYKTENGRGGQKAATAKFGVSAVTLTNWLKGEKKKRGRKLGSKNSPESKVKKIAKEHNPEDLRRLAALIEEIQELETLVERLDGLRTEASTISIRMMY